ncbi:MAG: nicotinate-nucleotide diphosphorylase (carboxylating) [Legionellales bacterium]|nr:nicotinate-nucleotide diphosphorylase (carboxylating) [Legionellales bacterium]
MCFGVQFGWGLKLVHVDSILHTLTDQVSEALAEDLGSGDVTAALIEPELQGHAVILARESMVLCGIPYVNEVFAQINTSIELNWHYQEGDAVPAGAHIVTLIGPVQSLLIGERIALNFLQTLSAVSTQTAAYVKAVQGTGAQIYDTRKTLPGWRRAQKYAVCIGGGCNHRMGLYDAFLIKENHIRALGSIQACVNAARAQHPSLPLEVEVESLAELNEALLMKVPLILLDNFDLDTLTQAVEITARQAVLEASGGVDLNHVHSIAHAGVDRIAVGALTKHIQAIDVSFQLL